MFQVLTMFFQNLLTLALVSVLLFLVMQLSMDILYCSFSDFLCSFIPVRSVALDVDVQYLQYSSSIQLEETKDS